MNINFQRKIDRYLGSMICFFLSLIQVKKKTASDFIPDKILVILLSEMGSLILARPMFQEIKNRYPGASINVLLFKQNKECLELLDMISPLNIHTVSNKSLTSLISSSLIALKRLRKIGIDTVIDCELFSRISSIFSTLTGAPLRSGFHQYTQEGLYRGNLVNRKVIYNPYIHISRQFINLVIALESDSIPHVKTLARNENIEIPIRKFKKQDVESFSNRFKYDFPVMDEKEIVLVYPDGGLLPERAWPEEYYCRVIKDLIKNGYAVGIIGLKEQKDIAGRILNECKNPFCIDLTGYTRTVKELMILFHFASLLITNDGGPGHFASMTPVPSIVLYGPETPVLYGTLDKDGVNMYSQMSCSPCLTAYNQRHSPCDGDNQCLKNILPEQVLSTVYGILEKSNSDFKANIE